MTDLITDNTSKDLGEVENLKKEVEKLKRKLERSYDIYEITTGLEKCLKRFFRGNPNRSYDEKGSRITIPDSMVRNYIFECVAPAVSSSRSTPPIEAVVANIRDAIMIEMDLHRKKDEPLDESEL